VDDSRSEFEKVDARFLGTHARLCKSFQFPSLEQEFAWEAAIRATQMTKDNCLLDFRAPTMLNCVGTFLQSLPGWTPLQLWRKFPETIRFAAYKGFEKLGAWLYGDREESAAVQRLQFGLYLKCHSENRGMPQRGQCSVTGPATYIHTYLRRNFWISFVEKQSRALASGIFLT
jgi:hypothetical protein